jgi:hypothetical protein
MIALTCPHCGRIGQVPDQAAGKKVRCPKCQGLCLLPKNLLLPEDELEVVETTGPSRAPSVRNNRVLILVCVVLLALFLVVSATVLSWVTWHTTFRLPLRNGNPFAAPVAAEPAVEVSAIDLFRDYEKDVVAADLKYLNRPLRLLAVSGKIEKDEQGRYFIGACQSRLVKTPERGARFMSSEEAAHRMYQDALNARYVHGLLL